ncbi:CopK family periplasmic copper-binding protein [Marinobacterium sp. AK62]|uniref:CopK family periplasmic copper-binding protein n=1 Tax=Marinobacterium alkalitolerans TaxID=1542925 RepID=A0ABS3ZA43_9GAMM|nr:CopK family periplasmic copper-binding protein [Marinobacterium alkalitolerans]MBP0048573.1 CopK family periplasmic copper-binding protein [Marinobacterium alkalitolerans]
MFKKTVLVAGLTLISVSAFANQQSVETVALESGATLYVFADGKMGMVDRYGRAASMESGASMKTADGDRIEMQGNEVARVGQILFLKNGPHY